MFLAGQVGMEPKHPIAKNIVHAPFAFSEAMVLQNRRALIYEVLDFRGFRALNSMKRRKKKIKIIEPLTSSTVCLNKRITFLLIDRYTPGTAQAPVV
jgi:hypothetical protein